MQFRRWLYFQHHWTILKRDDVTCGLWFECCWALFVNESVACLVVLALLIVSYLKFWPDFGTSFDSQSKTFWFLKSKLSIFRFMPNFQFSSFLKFLNTPFGPFCGTGTGTGLIWDWDCWTIIISYNYIFIDNVIWPKTCRFTRESSIYVLLNFLHQ